MYINGELGLHLKYELIVYIYIWFNFELHPRVYTYLFPHLKCNPQLVLFDRNPYKCIEYLITFCLPGNLNLARRNASTTEALAFSRARTEIIG